MLRKNMPTKQTIDESPATMADLEGVKGALATLTAEVSDIRHAAAKLADGDPSNNAGALLEIFQSLGVIGATLMGMAAAAVYIAKEFGAI